MTPIIGRKENASFPLFNLEKVVVKIDTGAYTSSIHCSHIEQDGDKVTCVFLDDDHPAYTGQHHSFEILKKVNVTSSNGQTEARFLIQSEIEILGRSHSIFLTLSNRHKMKYPVLIGRRFLKDKFLVDVALKQQIINP